MNNQLKLKSSNISFKFEKILKNIIYIIFAILFSFGIYCAYIGKYSVKIKGINNFIIIFGAVLLIIFFILIFKLIEKLNLKNTKSFYIIVGIFFFLFFVIQIIIGLILQFQPAYDMSAIYNNAIEWCETGSFSHINYPTAKNDYFYYFPNNLGAMWVLAFIFKIANFFGCNNYFLIGIVFNSLLMSFSFFVFTLIIKTLVNEKAALFSGILLLLFPVFYFAGGIFYTDYLSISFPIFGFYFYLRGLNNQIKFKKIIFFVLSIILLSIGIQIKFTVIICAIAIILHGLINKKFKQIIIYTLSFVVVLLSFNYTIKNISYTNNNLNVEKAEKLNTPYSHWIMMGLSGSGGYNGKDYEFTRSFDDTVKRNNQINNEIKNRIEKLGFFGLLDLFNKKSSKMLGDGTIAQSDFLDDKPKNNTVLNSFILYESEYYNIYKAICCMFFLSFLILSLFASVFNIIKFNKNNKDNSFKEDNIIPFTCLIGIFIFLMFWEMNSRYITNFVPMLIICAVFGVTNLSNLIKKPKYLQKNEKSEDNKNIIITVEGIDKNIIN